MINCFISTLSFCSSCCQRICGCVVLTVWSCTHMVALGSNRGWLTKAVDLLSALYRLFNTSQINMSSHHSFNNFIPLTATLTATPPAQKVLMKAKEFSARVSAVTRGRKKDEDEAYFIHSSITQRGVVPSSWHKYKLYLWIYNENVHVQSLRDSISE